MKLQTLFEEKKVVFSLEIFPPKKTSSIQTIYDTLDALRDIEPDFISVTYGAGILSRFAIFCLSTLHLCFVKLLEDMLTQEFIHHHSKSAI